MDNLNLYIIAGCNGAGKTTASLSVLPDIGHCVIMEGKQDQLWTETEVLTKC